MITPMEANDNEAPPWTVTGVFMFFLCLFAAWIVVGTLIYCTMEAI